MGRDPGGLDDPEQPRDRVRSGAVKAAFYEATDRWGDKQASVVLERSYLNAHGQPRILKLNADLDRLETVVNYGNDLKTRLLREPGRAEQETKAPELELGSWTARYSNQLDPAGKPQVVVSIVRHQGEEIKERFSCNLADLTSVAAMAIAFEQRQGYAPKWSPVVKVASLAEEGWVRAEVLGWSEGKPAQRLLDQNRKYGYGLCERSYRGQPGSLLVLKETEVPSLSADIRFLKAELTRVGPGLLLGIWCQKGHEPYAGIPVHFYGGRDPLSREPTDYRIVPAGVQKPQGPNERPINIIVNVDTKNDPPIHRIREVIHDAEQAKGRLQEIKAMVLEQLRHEEAMDLSRWSLPRGHRC